MIDTNTGRKIVHIYNGISCDGPVISCGIWGPGARGRHPACHSTSAYLFNLGNEKDAFNYCSACQDEVPQAQRDMAFLNSVKL